MAKRYVRLAKSENKSNLRLVLNALSHNPPITGLGHHPIHHPNTNKLPTNEHESDEQGKERRCESAMVEAAVSILKLIHFQSDDNYNPDHARNALSGFSEQQLSKAMDLLSKRGYATATKSSNGNSLRTHKMHNAIYETLNITHIKPSVLQSATKHKRGSSCRTKQDKQDSNTHNNHTQAHTHDNNLIKIVKLTQSMNMDMILP